jgi:anti-anti-sigma factor
MFEVRINEHGHVLLNGRFDAAQVEKARAVFDQIDGSRIVDFAELEYISSAGLGVLLMTQKRLADSGAGLTIRNMNPHIRNVFRLAGFDTIFEIE